jgi:hypothetical protein
LRETQSPDRHRDTRPPNQLVDLWQGLPRASRNGLGNGPKRL